MNATTIAPSSNGRMTPTKQLAKAASSRSRSKTAAEQKPKATHLVRINVLGLAGITVNRKNCNDFNAKHGPAPPSQMKAVVAFSRDEEIRATTILSRTLARSPNDDEVISKGAAEGEGVSVRHPSSNANDNSNTQRHVAVWASEDGRSLGSLVSFEVALSKLDKKKQQNNSRKAGTATSTTYAPQTIDMTLALAVDSDNDNKVAIPFGVGGLKIFDDGSVSKTSHIVDLPVHSLKEANARSAKNSAINRNMIFIRPKTAASQPAAKKKGLKRLFRKSEAVNLKIPTSAQQTAFANTYSTDATGDAILRLQIQIIAKNAPPRNDRSAAQVSARSETMATAKKPLATSKTSSVSPLSVHGVDGAASRNKDKPVTASSSQHGNIATTNTNTTKVANTTATNSNTTNIANAKARANANITTITNNNTTNIANAKATTTTTTTTNNNNNTAAPTTKASNKTITTATNSRTTNGNDNTQESHRGAANISASAKASVKATANTLAVEPSFVLKDTNDDDEGTFDGTFDGTFHTNDTETADGTFITNDDGDDDDGSRTMHTNDTGTISRDVASSVYGYDGYTLGRDSIADTLDQKNDPEDLDTAVIKMFGKELRLPTCGPLQVRQTPRGDVKPTLFDDDLTEVTADFFGKDVRIPICAGLKPVDEDDGTFLDQHASLLSIQAKKDPNHSINSMIRRATDMAQGLSFTKSTEGNSQASPKVTGSFGESTHDLRFEEGTLGEQSHPTFAQTECSDETNDDDTNTRGGSRGSRSSMTGSVSTRLPKIQAKMWGSPKGVADFQSIRSGTRSSTDKKANSANSSISERIAQMFSCGPSEFGDDMSLHSEEGIPHLVIPDDDEVNSVGELTATTYERRVTYEKRRMLAAANASRRNAGAFPLPVAFGGSGMCGTSPMLREQSTMQASVAVDSRVPSLERNYFADYEAVDVFAARSSSQRAVMRPPPPAVPASGMASLKFAEKKTDDAADVQVCMNAASDNIKISNRSRNRNSESSEGAGKESSQASLFDGIDDMDQLIMERSGKGNFRAEKPSMGSKTTNPISPSSLRM